MPTEDVLHPGQRLGIRRGSAHHQITVQRHDRADPVGENQPTGGRGLIGQRLHGHLVTEVRKQLLGVAGGRVSRDDRRGNQHVDLPWILKHPPRKPVYSP